MTRNAAHLPTWSVSRTVGDCSFHCDQWAFQAGEKAKIIIGDRKAGKFAAHDYSDLEAKKLAARYIAADDESFAKMCRVYVTKCLLPHVYGKAA